MTPGFRAIIEEAERAGMTIRRAASGSVLIVAKVDGRNGSISRGATLYPDGVAINAAVDLSAACGVRRLDSVRAMLRLPRG